MMTMNPEMDLINACKNNVFPSLYTMGIYGLNGEGKSNPIDILNCYKTLIVDDKLTCNDLKKCKDINGLFSSSKNLKNKPHYHRVMNSDGVVLSCRTNVECEKCFYNGVNKPCC
jgi:hypothetical protein